MSTLSIVPFRMPAASLGRPNPLPDLSAAGDLHADLTVDESVSAEESRYMGYARVKGILPYTLQDGYDRVRRPRDFKAAVLENGHLRATFLPQLGGRLWSLFDKDAGRELLHVNPVFQPCNLALRNAWISGGVEWNLGIIGHTPFTVSDLCAEELALADGTPVLRLFEYERVRGLFYRVEAFLPDDSRELYVRVRIDNAMARDTAVYWWSNMAVNQGEDVRVLVPAERAFRLGYGGRVSKIPIPMMRIETKEGAREIDISRSTQIPQAMDFFFDVDRDARPFLAALDGSGYGMCQTSTAGLRGRKLFVWGMGAGGRHWQRFLSDGRGSYIELQSGLAKTQLEHLPMKGGESISWLESYGPLQAEPERVFSQDWRGAVRAAEEALLEQRGGAALTEEMHQRAARELDGKTGRVLHRGMGFARAEKQLRGKAFDTAGLSLSAMRLGREEAPWMRLAKDGSFPRPDPKEPPASYMLGDVWEDALERACAGGEQDNWYAFYQLGVMRAAALRDAEAEKALRRSLALEHNAWALRCLAVLTKRAGREGEAAELLCEAAGMVSCRQLYIEALEALRVTEQYERLLDLADSLPAPLRRLGRVQTCRAAALMRLGRYEEAEKVLEGRIVLTDVREGDVLLSELWFELKARKKFGRADEEALAWAKEHLEPPEALDFRMK